jgi:hypothetical protein
MHVRLPLIAGQGCRWEASSDLVNWDTLFVNLVTDDQAGFVDDDTVGVTARFYRVVSEAVVIDDD